MIEGHRRSQIMQAYAICHGITAKTSTRSSDLAIGSLDGHKRLASYQFHPVSEKTGKVRMDISDPLLIFSFISVSGNFCIQ